MPGKRTYGQGCAAAHALDLVGERWALLVVRELLLGPKRFTDLRAGLAAASPNVISQRLRELEEAGIVRRRVLAPPAASRVYELTEWGRELQPVMVALGRWGSRSPLLPQAPMSVDSAVLALRTMFDPAAADGLAASVELRIGGQPFHADVRDGCLELDRGAAGSPDIVIDTDENTLVALVFGGRDLGEAIAAGTVAVTGDRRTARRFLRLFPLPEPAVAGDLPVVVQP